MIDHVRNNARAFNDWLADLQSFTALVKQHALEFQTSADFGVPVINLNRIAFTDAILSGTITSVYIAPLTYDSVNGRISSSLVVIMLNANLTDKKGKVLWSNPNLVYREQYQESVNTASFFEEATPAAQRIADSFAKTLVANILEAY